MTETAIITTVDLGLTDARARCDRIKSMVEAVTEDIISLYEGRGWLALGYPSWSELCRVEFDGVQLTVPGRRSLVNELREGGLSMRAIASATGTTKSTAARDLQVSHRGTPGVPDLFADHHEQHVHTTISGTDGKRYAAQRPAAPVVARPKRRPLSDDMRSAIVDLTKVTRRLQKILEDDRFATFAEHFAREYGSDINNADAVLFDLLEAIGRGGF